MTAPIQKVTFSQLPPLFAPKQYDNKIEAKLHHSPVRFKICLGRLGVGPSTLKQDRRGGREGEICERKNGARVFARASRRQKIEFLTLLAKCRHNIWPLYVIEQKQVFSNIFASFRAYLLSFLPPEQSEELLSSSSASPRVFSSSSGCSRG